MAKIVIGSSIDEKLVDRVDHLYAFKGYKSRSSLIETLLEKWVLEVKKNEGIHEN